MSHRARVCVRTMRSCHRCRTRWAVRSPGAGPWVRRVLPVARLREGFLQGSSRPLFLDTPGLSRGEEKKAAAAGSLTAGPDSAKNEQRRVSLFRFPSQQ